MGVVGFAQQQDSAELVKALADEGYQVALRESADGAPAPWIVTVEPFDDRVVDMVDVYGGWIPGDAQLAD